MPSILQGRDKAPPAEAPPEMPAQGAPADDGRMLVGSLYEKPDGTYCIEDPTGQVTEFPDIESALSSMSGVMGEQDMPPSEDTGEASGDYD